MSDVRKRVEAVREILDTDPGLLLVVAGPTASGKTELAVALAEELDAEVVSADSVQIYRHFDIGSGKPSREELRCAPHHLLDALDPLEGIDAGQFALRAAAAIAEIQSRGKRALVCGGTFLWIKALTQGLAQMPPADASLRAEHRALVETEGRPALHARLEAVDPVLAARLHPQDFVRVSRALEVHALTGRALSAWHEEHGFAVSRYRTRIVAPLCLPEELDRRIATRTDMWLQKGWRDEVQDLLDRGYGSARAMQSVGYKQVHAALQGLLTLEDLAPAIVRATRVTARRQRTWLRSADVTWLSL